MPGTAIARVVTAVASPHLGLTRTRFCPGDVTARPSRARCALGRRNRKCGALRPSESPCRPANATLTGAEQRGALWVLNTDDSSSRHGTSRYPRSLCLPSPSHRSRRLHDCAFSLGKRCAVARPAWTDRRRVESRCPGRRHERPRGRVQRQGPPHAALSGSRRVRWLEPVRSARCGVIVERNRRYSCMPPSPSRISAVSAYARSTAPPATGGEAGERLSRSLGDNSTSWRTTVGDRQPPESADRDTAVYEHVCDRHRCAVYCWDARWQSSGPGHGDELAPRYHAPGTVTISAACRGTCATLMEGRVSAGIRQLRRARNGNSPATRSLPVDDISTAGFVARPDRARARRSPRSGRVLGYRGRSPRSVLAANGATPMAVAAVVNA